MSDTLLAAQPPRSTHFDERTERLLWVLLFAILVCVRMPDIVIQGRFWAEEGNPDYQFAWTLPWYQVLLETYDSYLSLPPNLAGLLARHLVQVEYAPYVSNFVALLIQLCPAILLATARDEWLQGRLRLLAALLLSVAVPASDEVWLTAIHAQVHLALCGGLILALETRGGAVGAFRLLLLLLGALSGPGVWTLLPLFVLRTAFDGTSRRAIQTGVLAVGIAIQLSFFFHFQLRPERVVAGPRMQMLIFFVKHLLVPFAGSHGAAAIASPIHQQVVAANAPIWPMVVTVVAFGAFAVAIAMQRVGPAVWMFLAGAALAVAGYSGALAGGPSLLYVFAGQRYAFAPTVLFALSILALACLARAGRLRRIAAALVVWLILAGALSYFTPTARVYAHGPDWRSQVAAWRADPSQPIAIWPAGWPPLHLPPEAR